MYYSTYANVRICTVYTSTLFLGIQTAVEVQILMLSNGVAGFWSCFHMHCVDCGLELLIYYTFLHFLCRLAMSSRWPRRIRESASAM